MKSITAHIPMLALVALTVLFGHDALMATGSHATTFTEHHEHSVADGGAGSHDAPAAGCHLPEGTRPAPSDLTEPLPSGTAAMPVPGPDDCQLSDLVAWQAPPVTPPDVARALLQVFLN